MRKVMVTMPEPLLRRVDTIRKKLRTTRSRFCREALARYLQELEREERELLMAEGYQEMAEENLKDAEGFLGSYRLLREEE